MLGSGYFLAAREAFSLMQHQAGDAGMQVIVVHPEPLLRGSRIWGHSWRENRARARGVDSDHLAGHYRKRTVLAVNVLSDDIAQAILRFVAGARSGTSTGNPLPVATAFRG